MEELNKNVPQLPWIVTIIGIAVAGYFFLSASKISTEILNHQNELDAYNLKLAQYKKLEETYGYGSKRYYAKQPILILKTAGNEGKIVVFWDSSNLPVPKGTESAIRFNFERDTSVDAEWAKDWYGDGHLTDLIVTPRKNAGCYPVTFTNNLNDDKFQVLVVVK